MSSYERFAYVYDQMGSDEFSVKMFDYTQQLLSRLGYRPRSVLELACGTGTAAIKWARQGMLVFGIDGSKHMLEMARQKAAESNLNIRLSLQPLTSFRLSHKVDLVTCYFDSINYLLSPEEVTRCFRSVEKVLHPGGYFIFDANTPEAMKTLWDSQTYAEVKEGMAWIWKNCYFAKAKRADVHATFFVRKNNTWERFDELHTERGYNATEIKNCLREAGMKPTRMYECLKFSKPHRKTLRLAVLARKPN